MDGGDCRTAPATPGLLIIQLQNRKLSKGTLDENSIQVRKEKYKDRKNIKIDQSQSTKGN